MNSTIYNIGDTVHAKHPITGRRWAVAEITNIDDDWRDWPFISLKFLDGSMSTVQSGYVSPHWRYVDNGGICFGCEGHDSEIF